MPSLLENVLLVALRPIVWLLWTGAPIDTVLPFTATLTAPVPDMLDVAGADRKIELLLNPALIPPCAFR